MYYIDLSTNHAMFYKNFYYYQLIVMFEFFFFILTIQKLYEYRYIPNYSLIKIVLLMCVI